MNKADKINQVYKQLAEKWNYKEEIFYESKNLVLLSKDDTFFEMHTFGEYSIILADERLLSWCGEYLEPLDAKDIMDGEVLFSVERKLREYGYQLGGEHVRCLRMNETKTAAPEGFVYRWFEQSDMDALYKNKGFNNALNYSRDVIAFGAYKDDELAALAAADDWLNELWQIGIDVLPKYRKMGLATYMVSELAEEIESRGKVVYYTTWSGNIASMLTALHAGFQPVWVEYHAEKSQELALPVQSSIFTPEALVWEVNKRYGLKTESCRLWSMGLNDIYVLQHNEEKYFLRISHTGRFSKQDYEEEMDMIVWLRERGINTCIPIKDMEGAYIWEVHAQEGRRCAVLFEEVKQDGAFSSYNMGQMAARLHEAADGKAPKINRQPILKEHLIEQPLRTISCAGGMKRTDLEFLKDAANEMWKDITGRIPREKPAYGFLHGDMHRGNIYFSGEVPQIFDFDCMGYGYRAYDLCVYLWDESMGNEHFMESDEWKEYIAGYQSIRKLAMEEQYSIPAFAALRQLWFIALIIYATRINNSWDGINASFFEAQMERFRYWYMKWKAQ